MTQAPRSPGADPIASAVAAALAAAGMSGEVLIVAAGMSAGGIVDRLRAAAADSPAALVVVVRADVGEPDRAMLIAAIGPLAVAFAPATRLSLVDVGAGAAADATGAAACFLATAVSTTGQIVRIAG